MCGVFGFVSRNGGEPNMHALKRIADVTSTRGRHAFGFSWVDSRGVLRCFKQTGSISDYMAVLNIAADARMLIGHCRYSTHGKPEFNINNHPHASDGGWIVHNGMLPDYQGLINRHDLFPVSHCDSELLGLLIEQQQGSILKRCKKAVNLALQVPEIPTQDAWGELAKTIGRTTTAGAGLVFLGLWHRPERMVVIRRGNPLSWTKCKEGYYLASLDEGMPGKPQSLKEGTAALFTMKDAEYATV